MTTVTRADTTTTMDGLAQNGAAIPHHNRQKICEFILKRVLTVLDIPDRRDEEGNLFAILLPTPTEMSTLGCWFLPLIDETRTIFRFFCTTDQTIPLKRVPTALNLCNSYHTQNRFGRAWIDIDEEQAKARLCFDASIDLTHTPCGDVMFDVLKNFFRTNLASAVGLFKMVGEEKGVQCAVPPGTKDQQGGWTESQFDLSLCF